MIDRFFQDECELGPEKRVTRTALFEAWERWCDSEGESAGSKKSFTSTMIEKGVVKGFGEKRIGNDRGWEGIGLTTPPSDPQSVRNSDSAYLREKERGVVNGTVHFSENRSEVLGKSSRVETYDDFAENCTQVYGSVRSGLKWEIDGVEWTYLPSEEK